MINALQAKARNFDIKKTCILVAIPPATCEIDGATACEQQCEEKMKTHPTYLRMMELKSRAAYTSMKSDAKSDRADASKRKEMQQASAEQALKDVLREADLRNATLVQRKAELEQAQKDFEDAEQAKQEAAETLERLTNSTKDEEQAAVAEEEQKQADIEAKVEQAYTHIQGIEDEKRETEAQMKKDGKRVSAPKECGDDKYCCCSIRFTAVKVKTSQFIDWDECKAAKTYPASEGKEGCRETMVHCPACAALLCADNGYGVCPG